MQMLVSFSISLFANMSISSRDLTPSIQRTVAQGPTFQQFAATVRSRRTQSFNRDYVLLLSTKIFKMYVFCYCLVL